MQYERVVRQCQVPPLDHCHPLHAALPICSSLTSTRRSSWWHEPPRRGTRGHAIRARGTAASSSTARPLPPALPNTTLQILTDEHQTQLLIARAATSGHERPCNTSAWYGSVKFHRSTTATPSTPLFRSAPH